MTALTRRTLGKLLACVGALLALPFQRSGAAPVIKPAPTLLRQAQAAIDALSAETLKPLLDGTYAKVFDSRQSTLQIEQTAHVRYPGLDDLKTGNVLRVLDRSDRSEHEAYDQRWVFNAETYELGFAFAVVADDDPRAGRPPQPSDLQLPHGLRIARPGIFGLGQIKQEPAACQPWRISDFPAALTCLTSVFQDAREGDAAYVLNNATTYDPHVCGDGKPLLSANHPWSEGVWANTFGDSYRPLDADTLQAAYAQIAQFCDESGMRIFVRPVALIVSESDADLGQRLAASQGIPCIVWPYLTPGAWFIKTSVPGLSWFKRDLFELYTWLDHETGTVVVIGYERRCFQYHDPRALFGCVPPRITKA